MEEEEKYAELIKILTNEKHIDELGIIPNSQSELVFIDGKLGISSGLSKKLYIYVYKQFFKLRSKPNFMGRCSECQTHEISNLSMVLLLINPECYTAWNARKELIIANIVSSDEEFRFMNLTLTCHPRSAELFIHRRWLIQYVIKNNDSDIITLCKLELKVATKAADQYYSNYISWSHRCWIVRTYLSDHPEILLSELENTTPWLSKHISDSNIYYYRQQLLTLLVEINHANSKKLWKHELQINKEMIEYYTGHEAMWLFRRFLLANIPEMNEGKTELYHEEMTFVNQYYPDEGASGYTFEADRQIHFAKSYKMFINLIKSDSCK